MLTSAVCIESSKVWQDAQVTDEVKERLFQLCHPCVFARNALVSNGCYLSKVPLLRITIAILQLFPFPADGDDLLQQSEVNIIIARGVAAFNMGSERPAYQDPRQPDQAAAMLPKKEQQEKKQEKKAAKQQEKKEQQEKKQERKAAKQQEMSLQQLKWQANVAPEKVAKQEEAGRLLSLHRSWHTRALREVKVSEGGQPAPATKKRKATKGKLREVNERAPGTHCRR
jgi:flagellar biosynthesis GTPase FlhF